MTLTIDLSKSPRYEMPCINDLEAQGMANKGWTLSSTYFFSEIRDVYLALRASGPKDLDSFYQFCLSIKLPFRQTPWHKRRLLEHLNALINFGLVRPDYSIARTSFVNSRIGDAVNTADIEVFREIYFSYFRFREIFSWFVELNPPDRLSLVRDLTRLTIENNTRPLFAFSEQGRFVNTFFCELTDNVPVYYLRHRGTVNSSNGGFENEDLMRFWDVFVVWGLALQVLEKFSLEDLNIRAPSGKNITCCFVIDKSPLEFDLKGYIEEYFRPGDHLFLPQLVFNIATTYRLSVKKTQDLIIKGYTEHKQMFSLERTSEIFVRRRETTEKDRILYPKYGDSYISHLTIRR